MNKDDIHQSSKQTENSKKGKGNADNIVEKLRNSPNKDAPIHSEKIRYENADEIYE